MKSLEVLIFLGPPGSGKGTQAEILTKKLNFTHLSIGDLLRENIVDNTELGKLASKYVKSGELVPDDLIIDLMDSYITELKDESNNILAFDGGYTKSRTAIIDANITTLLAAIILFFMGSGPVKGFAVTLGVGIFTTLFSVYFIARLFTSLYVTRNKNKEKLI